MEDIKFTSLNELYNRLLPALKARKVELVAGGLHYVMSEDIWNYLKETKWKNAPNLTLHDMASDILSCEHYDIDFYIKTKMKKIKRDLTPDDSIL